SPSWVSNSVVSSPPFVLFTISSLHDVCFTMMILLFGCFVFVKVHVTTFPAPRCMPVDGMSPLSHVAPVRSHPAFEDSDTVYIPDGRLSNDFVPVPELVVIVNDNGNGMPEVVNVNVSSATHLCLQVISSPPDVWCFTVT